MILASLSFADRCLLRIETVVTGGGAVLDDGMFLGIVLTVFRQKMKVAFNVDNGIGFPSRVLLQSASLKSSK